MTGEPPDHLRFARTAGHAKPIDPPSAWTHFDSSTREVCRSLHAHAHEPEKFLPGHCAVRTTQLTFCSLSARPKPSVSIRRYRAQKSVGSRHASRLTAHAPTRRTARG